MRKWAVQGPVLAALTAVLLGGGAFARATAQTTQEVDQAPIRDTNSTREARIRRTIDETYAHRWEIYGGGGFLRFRSGDQVKRDNQVSWAMSSSYFFSHKIAAVAEAQGSFGHAVQPDLGSTYYPQAPNPQINEYMFLGGGGYRFYGDQTFDAMAVVLGGTAWGIFSGGSKTLSTQDIGLWNDGFRPAFSAGVNLDFNLYQDIALRVTPYYMPTMFHSSATPGSLQNNFGFNAGVVYRFGHQ